MKPSAKCELLLCSQLFLLGKIYAEKVKFMECRNLCTHCGKLSIAVSLLICIFLLTWPGMAQGTCIQGVHMGLHVFSVP